MMQQKRYSNPKILIFIIVEIAIVIIGILCSIAYGSKSIPPWDVLGLLFDTGSDSFEAAVVHARIPRTVFGVLAGSALGVSGALMQAITRNPVADPSILGVNTGASLMVVIGIAYLNISSGLSLIGLSFVGAILTALFVYGIASYGFGGANSLKLALSGAAVSTALGAMVNTIMLPDSQVMKAFRFWQIGSISGATWDDIKLVLPFIIIGIVMSFALAPSLNAMALGDEMAVSLGVKVGLVRAISALAGVMLCAVITAIAGPVGFVGLMLPHLVRQLLDNDMRLIIPFSAIGGAGLLVLSDVLGRILGRPGELEVGIVTAILGAPIFIWIVCRSKTKSI
ncbi:MAG: iron ABC transporter permease [Butyrivibrio sp.]|nr:iron ABC transporter permease [Butyrivibrio sp.]